LNGERHSSDYCS